MRQDFVVANRILRGLNLTYWIDCGTLLGAVREGDFLAHDLDFDFGTVEWSRHGEIAAAFKAEGFQMDTAGHPEYGYQQAFFKEKRHLFDIFYFYPAGLNRLWQGSWYQGEVLWSEFDLDAYLPVNKAWFVGEATFTPAKPEKVLETRYGDWRTPVVKWSYVDDPKCLQPARF